jgi:hypothetical protein
MLENYNTELYFEAGSHCATVNSKFQTNFYLLCRFEVDYVSYTTVIENCVRKNLLYIVLYYLFQRYLSVGFDRHPQQ